MSFENISSGNQVNSPSFQNLPGKECAVRLAPITIGFGDAYNQSAFDGHPWKEVYNELGLDTAAAGMVPHTEDMELALEYGANTYRKDLFAISRLVSPISDLESASKTYIEFYPGFGIESAELLKAFEELRLLYNRGISLTLTLWHWDYPSGVVGGWENDQMVDIFKAYIQKLFNLIQAFCQKELKCAIHEAIPIAILANEPLIFAGNTTLYNEMYPYQKFRVDKYISVIKNLAAAAVESKKIVKSADPQIQTTVSNNLAAYTVAPSSLGIVNKWNEYVYQLLQRYDADLFYWLMTLSEEEKNLSALELFFKFITELPRPELPVEVVALNFWHSRQIRMFTDSVETNLQQSEYGWNLDPVGFLQLLHQTSLRYPGKKIIVTEFGCHFADKVVTRQELETRFAGEPDNLAGYLQFCHEQPNGTLVDLNDYDRMQYISQIMIATQIAIDAGIDVEIDIWGLLDHLEWQRGIARRGVFYVDPLTGERIQRRSGAFLSDLIKTRSMVVPQEWVDMFAQVPAN